MLKIMSLFIIISVSVITSFSASAQSPENPCKDKNVGDSVNLTSKSGKSVEATCKTVKGKLIAVMNTNK